MIPQSGIRNPQCFRPAWRLLLVAALGLLVGAGCFPPFLAPDEPPRAAKGGAKPAEVETLGQFRERVLLARGRVVAHFYMSWCQACKTMFPTVRHLAAQYAGKVTFVDVDLAKVGDPARTYQIVLAPTLLFFADGRLVRRIVGTAPEAEVRAAIEGSWAADPAEALSQLSSARRPDLPISEARLRRRITAALEALAGTVESCRKLELGDGVGVYDAIVVIGRERKRLFARAASHRPMCPSCHDVHFVYLFDADGVVVDLVPIQLPKAGNREFSAADLARFKRSVIGRNLNSPFEFNADVDAVTGATITCALVFDRLREGKLLLDALKRLEKRPEGR